MLLLLLLLFFDSTFSGCRYFLTYDLVGMRHALQQFDKITILMILPWVRLLPRRRRRHLDH